ncbi:amidase family protein [Nocardioides sp.]|uniref:amidase family protein n=1 Tax=Nocardioides sp. TaxID=35761 RepID=UPI0039E42240
MTTPVGAAGALAALRSGQVTAVGLLTGCLAAVEAGAAINSVVRLDAERALARAAEIDRQLADGQDLPALAGLPITVKDSFDVAGLESGQGLDRPDHLAESDAPAVAALRAAGAVILGKTNVPARLADYQASSGEFGQTLNPADPTRTAGGSSGGGAAVAAGQSLLDLGSDMAGSVRIPAAYCGIAAWRPTHGLVSKERHLPWPGSLTVVPPASTPGLLAPRVADLVAPAAVLAGTAAPRSREPRVIGVWRSGWPLLGAEVAAVIDSWLDAAREAGLEIVEIAPALADRSGAEVYEGLIAAEIAHGAGDTAAAPPLLDLLERQQRAVAEWERLTEGVDAVLAPVAPVVAPRLSEVPVAERQILIDGVEHPASQMLVWAKVTSLPQAPSVTTPIGRGADSGMPVGVQFIGRRHHDLDLIAAIAVLEARGLVGPTTLPTTPSIDSGEAS